MKIIDNADLILLKLPLNIMSTSTTTPPNLRIFLFGKPQKQEMVKNPTETVLLVGATGLGKPQW